MAEETKASLVPPNNLEAEQGVLGAVLLRAQSLDEVADLLTPEDFYRPSHGRIYETMLDLWNRKEPVDLVTVNALLNERGWLEEVGGPVFLASLSEHVGTAANAAAYAQMVRDKSRLRRFLEIMQQLTAECFGPIEDVGAFFDQAESRLFQVDRPRGTTQSLAEIVPAEKARIESLHGRKGLVGMSTGFLDLDRITGGFQQGDLIILAARPGMGKSAMALNILLSGAQGGEPGAIFSLEMSKAQLVQRLMANVGQINATRLRTATMEAEEWVRFMDVEGELISQPIFINDLSGLTPLELRAQARRLKAAHDIGLVVVDYLQLMHVPKAKSREQEVSEISRSLKALAKELQVPVLALSQLNREVEKRTKNRRPVMSDLRDSGSLEQDADLILFIYRDEMYREDSPEKSIAEINVSKQRMGPTRKFNLIFQAEFSRFLNYAE